MGDLSSEKYLLTMTEFTPIRQAIIAAGGRGFRLGPKYEDKQKCLLEIDGERPILYYLIQLFKHIGCKTIHLIGGHRYEDLICYAESLEDSALQWIHGQAVGTAHALLRLESAITGSFLYSSGDILFGEGFLRNLVQHHHGEWFATLAVSKQIAAPTHPRILFNCDDLSNRIFDIRFVGESEGDLPPYSTMELGVFSPSVFRYLNRVSSKDMITKALFLALREGKWLKAVLNELPWYHVTTESDLLEIRRNFTRIKAGLSIC